MKPTTAVIFAAGIGTRMLPITAAVQKELLPIGDRPVIDYIVSDLVAAGITKIIIVIRPGQTGLKDYFLGNAGLESQLRRLGKTAALEQLARIHAQAEFVFVEQSEAAGYGTAIPLQVALPLLDPTQPVVVCGGDDLVWHPDGASEMQAFIKTYAHSGAEGAIMGLDLVDDELSQFGIITSQTGEAGEYLTDILEKPTPGQTPSRLANVSKYILNGAIRDYIQAVQPRAENSESYIIDGIVASSQSHKIIIHHISGAYLDTGTLASWYKANQVVNAASTLK